MVGHQIFKYASKHFIVREKRFYKEAHTTWWYQREREREKERETTASGKLTSIFTSMFTGSTLLSSSLFYNVIQHHYICGQNTFICKSLRKHPDKRAYYLQRLKLEQYTKDQRVQILKLLYKFGECYAEIVGRLHEIFGNRNAPNVSTLHRLLMFTPTVQKIALMLLVTENYGSLALFIVSYCWFIPSAHLAKQKVYCNTSKGSNFKYDKGPPQTKIG
ncbi:hypothetical protein C0J52_23190 [Blattella germanica]|nr:hypothetical protein C0J52_23190 [Blattella germanica]